MQGLPPASICSLLRVFPGDRLEILIPLDKDASAAVSKPAGTEDLEVISCETEILGGERWLRMELRPWQPGLHVLEAFVAGGVRIGPLKISVESALEAYGSEPRGQRALLLLPGTKTAIGLSLSFLAALILAAWAFSSLALPWIRRILRWRRGRGPYRRFLRDAAVLSKRATDADGRYFYSLLSRAFRAWAAASIHPAIAALTAAEIGGLTAEEDPAPQESGEDLQGPNLFTLASRASPALRRADLVRFAGEDYGADLRRADLALLSEIAAETEEARALL